MRMRYSHAIQSPPFSERWRPWTILVGRPTAGAPTYIGFTMGETITSLSTLTTPVQVWTGPSRASTWDGKAYLGGLLRQTNTRLYAAVTVNRGFAWNVARIYSLSLIVTYNELPVADLLTPTGAQVISRPVFSWDYTDPDGDSQGIYDARIYTAAQVASPSFDLNDTARVKPAYIRQVWSGANTHAVEAPFGANGAYRAYLRATHGSVSGIVPWSAWDFLDFTLAVEAPVVPTLTATFDAASQSIIVVAQGGDNLLSWGASSFEVVPSPALIAGTNTTLTRTTAQAAHGTWSYQMQRTGSTGTAQATIHATSGVIWGIPVEEAEQYTARASFRAATTGRSCRVGVAWFDINGAQIGTTTFGSNVTDNNAGWTEATLGLTTAPAGALYARVVCEVLSAAASESHYLDKTGLFYGTVAAWNRGGFVGDDHIIYIQRSTDAGTTWEDVPFSFATIEHEHSSQTTTYADYEVASAQTVHYRARTESTNQDGDPVVSDWSTTDDATMATFTDWWIRDLASPGEMSMALHVSHMRGNRDKPQSVGYPIDSDAAVVSHDGVKQPTLRIEGFCLNEADFDMLNDLIEEGRTLLLQDTLGHLWYVQARDDFGYEQIRAVKEPGETTPTRHAYSFEVTFTSVERPIHRVDAASNVVD
jgi:hypothetical protein